MKKIYFTSQYVASILIAAVLFFNFVRVTIEKLNVFYSIMFGFMFLVGFVLVKLSWKELKGVTK